MRGSVEQDYLHLFRNTKQMNIAHARQLVAEHGTPTLFLSKERARSAYQSLGDALPGVTQYYAAKSNCEPSLIKILDAQGSNFDVCTNGEIDVIRACGISPDRCLHSHPIKRDSDLRYAIDFGIKLFVADNEAELQKLVPYKDDIELLIRMSILNTDCLVNLSLKFGAAPDAMFDLILKAAALGLKVRGISFHVGSQNENPLIYIEALEHCRAICRKAALAGISIDIIDIGGGFPIKYLKNVMSIAQFCQPMTEYINRFFTQYRVIAEPGRFISGTTMTLAAKVIGKSMRHGNRWYYMDEGLYGSFSGKVYDHIDYPMVVDKYGPKFNSVLAGPTCDSTDVVYENVMLPELDIGDVLFFPAMGAYTNASASTFNGFPKAKIVVVDDL